jgi:O-acetyl-ADP-ribose deacetylase (regulator of RNase III)
MIEHIKGDLLSIADGYIIHGCNAQGVMGGGVAKLIKDKYPLAFKDYALCLQAKRTLNKPALGSNTYSIQGNNLVIVNAVTQEYYGTDKRYTDYDAVRMCFADFMDEIDTHPTVFEDVPRVLNFPLIGCGLGGGDWEVIEQIIEEEIDDSFIKRLWTL